LTNGTITLNISGAGSPFYYSIDNGQNYYVFSGSPYVIAGLSGGFYDIRVRNSAGCVMNIYDVEVGQGGNGLITGSISVVSAPSCGNSDGSLKLVVTGGSGVYEYQLNGSGGYLPLASSGIISGLAANNYNLLVREIGGGGCNDLSYTLALENINAAVKVLTKTTINASACLATNGSLTFTVSGDTLNYSYSTNNGSTWFPANRASVTVTGLGVGDYTLLLRDAANCVNPGGSFTIGADNSGITFTLSEVLKATCTGSNGSLGITVTSGSPTAYRLNGGLWVPMTGSVQVSVPAGEYIVDLRQGICITKKDTQEIGIDDPSFAASLNSTASTNCGLDNGTITLNIIGAGSFSYSIDNGVNYYAFSGSPYVIGGLSPGIYDIKIKNATGCVINVYGAEVLRGSSDVLIVGSISVASQPTCGHSNGSLKVVVTGASSYEYDLNSSGTFLPLPTNGIISGLAGGNYAVLVQATGGGCNDLSYTLPLMNIDAATQVVSITTINATNCTSGDGSMTFTVSGDTLNYSYRLNGLGSWISANRATVTVTGLAVGDYTLEILDSANCVNPGGQFTIGANNSGMEFVLSEDLKATCTGGNGLLGITVTLGNPTSYRLNNGPWVPMIGSVQVSVPAGEYIVELRDGTGCITKKDTQTIGLEGTTFAA
jgi:hypothetical protein